MARRFTKPTGPFTAPGNLEQAGVDSARNYYRDQNTQDVAHNDVLGQAVHMGQAAQATTIDPMGLKGLMQALNERGAVAGRSLALPDAPLTPPSTLWDPAQTSAVDPVMGLAGLSKKRKT
jgi:hypothetical protein